MQFQGGNNMLQKSRSQPDFDIDYQQMPLEQDYNEEMQKEKDQGGEDTQYGRAQKKLVEQDNKLKKMQQERKVQDQMVGSQNSQGQQKNVNFRNPIPKTQMMSNYGPQPAQGFNQNMNNQEDYEREDQGEFVDMGPQEVEQEYPEDMYNEQQQMMQMEDEVQNGMQEQGQEQPYFIKDRGNNVNGRKRFKCFFIIGIFMSILLFYKISKDSYNFIPKKYSVASYILVILSLSFIVTTIIIR